MSKRSKQTAVQDALAAIPDDRAGLPAKDSIRAVEGFVAPGGEAYLILKTTEVDAYDEPAKAKPKPRRRSPKTG